MRRYPVIAGLLSMLVPGLGQIYGGENNKGGAMIFGAVVIANLNILILPLISVANPTIPLGAPDARTIWAYFIPRVVHDVASLWSIAYWVWAIADSVTHCRRKENPIGFK
jgi:TM2 domain-containing membrane protein YozV